jgi:tetratricopeptide (TPR) repeat protein
MELELKERPGQLYYRIEYGRTLLMLEDPRGAEVLGEAAARLLPHANEPAAPMPIVSLLLEQLLQFAPEQLPPGFSPQLVESLVWRWFPANAPLLWILARRSAMAGDFAAAEQLLRRLIDLGMDHSYEQWVSFDPVLIGDGAKSNLGACLLRQGKLDEAMSVFRGLLTSPTHGAQAQSNLEAIEQFLRQS